MTHGRSALLSSWAATMLLPAAANAGVWGSDPVLGVTGEFASNPLLVDLPHTAQADGAVLIDAPTTFNGDAFKLYLLPSFRISDTRNYASMNSDYEHLSMKGEFDTERDVLTATIGASRDSSLYADYLTDGQAGVRRDGLTGDLSWARLLTEKLALSTDANIMRVQYGIPEGTASLISYKYTSLSPTITWTLSPRAKFTFSASGGQYDSLDDTTRSRNANLEVGFVRPLTELWSVSVDGGYSRELNRANFVDYLVLTPAGLVIETSPNGLVLETIPVRIDSSENSSVYSGSITRQTERLMLTATASRQEIPTGFAFLSRQNAFELKGNYTLSARWSMSADARYVGAQDPQLQGGTLNRRVTYFALNSYWQWTEHWTVIFGASRVTERFQSNHVDLVSNQVQITLSRNFNHISFQ
jgi:hypothetical protein